VTQFDSMKKSHSVLLSGAALIFALGNLPWPANRVIEARPARYSSAARSDDRVKVADGEYMIYEQANGGAVGPFEERIYDFHESWTMWRDKDGGYEVEGERRFESPRERPFANRFRVELTRDLTVIRMKEFTQLKWVPDSGPLSCEFLFAELDCSAGGSNLAHAIQMKTPLTEPFGILWPISPFSLSGLTREVERDSKHPKQVALVSIEQPSTQNPVATTILAGPLTYLGEVPFRVADRLWQAREFSLKIPGHPRLLMWTSPKGLLLSITAEHQHKNWADEGMRLASYQSADDFQL
jgi:hypothetical protein